MNSTGWESRVKGLHDVGYSWRELANMVGMDKMTLWRQCSPVEGDAGAAVYERLNGEESRVWLTPDERLKDLGVYALKNKKYRSVTDEQMSDEWIECARRDIERGVALVDIARMSGMTRDQANYRLRKK